MFKSTLGSGTPQYSQAMKVAEMLHVVEARRDHYFYFLAY